MEQTQGEVDALHGNETVALLSLATDSHVVQSEMFEFLKRPWCEHKPGYDRVDEENEGVGDSSSHAVAPSVNAHLSISKGSHLL